LDQLAELGRRDLAGSLEILAAYQEVMPRPFPARITVTGGVDPFRMEISATAVVRKSS